MKIALWNASGLDNLGDLVLDTVNRVEISSRLRGAAFQTFCPWPLRFGTSKLYVDPNGLWAGSNQFDAIVVGGGALLMGPPFAHPGLQSFYLGSHPERFRDRAVVIWNAVCSDGQAARPLSDRFREYVQAATSRCDIVSVRNQRTLRYLREWGVTSQIDVVPDPAVLAATPDTLRPRAGYRPAIGWLAARRQFAPQFIELMRISAIEDLAGADPSLVRLTATEAASDVTGTLENVIADGIARLAQHADLRIAGLRNMYCDSEYAEERASKIGLTDKLTDALTDNIGDFLSWVGECDCVIASRLHHCIISIAAGVPVVAIDLHQSPLLLTSKLREFMVGAGLEDLYVAGQELAAGVKSLDAIVACALSSRERVHVSGDTLRSAAREHFDVMAEVIARRK